MKNYYQIHKNKKPKSIEKRKVYVDLSNIQVRLATALSLSQIQIVNSQQLFSPHSRVHKALRIADIVMNNATTIINIQKQERIRKFKITKRYT